MKMAASRAALGGLSLASALAIASTGALFAMAPTPQERITTLQAQRTELLNSSQAIVDGLGEGEDLTDAQVTTINDNKTEIERIDGQISALQAVMPVGTGARAANPRPAAGGGGGGGGGGNNQRVAPRFENGTGGFKRMGDFAQCVHAAVVRKDASANEKLQNAATTFGSEGVGADGGFLVPPDFRKSIWQKVMEQENLLTRCDPVEIEGNNITYPKDETTPWDTSNGVQAYWEAEGAAGTGTKPKFEEATMRLQKLFALVPVTEELLSDAPGLESWLRRKAPQKMTAKINTAIINGTGVGTPLGILKAPCLITVNKVLSQAADTVYFQNINDMWGRMYAPCRRSAIWLINQDVEAQLDSMAFAPGATVPTAASGPAYLPPGGLSDTPYARLKGRPVVPVESCSALGDVGDIILADMTQYMTLLKAGQDVKTDVSMHLYFDQDMQAFRFIFRVNGQPSWGSTLARENGSNTLSPFVTLQAR